MQKKDKKKMEETVNDRFQFVQQKPLLIRHQKRWIEETEASADHISDMGALSVE